MTWPSAQAETDHANVPFFFGEAKYMLSQTIKQDAGRVIDLEPNTLMALDSSTRKWVPLTSVDFALTPGRMVCGAFGSTPAIMQAITDGEFAVSIDGVAMDITGLDFSPISAGTDAPATGVCGALGTNLAGMQAVTDGSFQITVNGVAHDITGLDWSSITALDEVVDTINAAVEGKQFRAIYDSKTTVVTFVSNKWGEQSTITALTAGSAGTDVSGSGFLNGLTGTITLTQGTGGDVWLTDMAQIINYAANGRFEVEWDGTQFQFISESQGVHSSVTVLSAVSGGSGTDISGASYLNGLTGTGTVTAGTGGDGEDIPAGIYRGSAILAATIVAGDVEYNDIIVGGPIVFDEDALVIENSLTMNDIVVRTGKTVRMTLIDKGLNPRTSADIHANV